MRDLRRTAIWLCCIYLVLGPWVRGARLDPHLQAVLQTSTSSAGVPVIILLSDQADLSGIEETDKELKRSEIVSKLKDKAQKTQGPLKVFLRAEGSKRTIPLWILNAIATTLPAGRIAALSSFAGVAGVYLDYAVEVPPVTVLGAEAAGPPEWNITAIRAPDLWGIGFTGVGIVVANTDTGVDVLHPDLGRNWRGGADSWYNPYSDPLNAGYCRIPNNCSPCELSSSVPCDVNGHGTGTMGLMAGGSTGGTTIGVAPDVKWVAVKALNDGRSGASSIILLGFQWMLALPPERAPDVVNNSWGFPNVNGCNTVFQSAIETMKAAGIEVVFSAGNSGPAGYTSVSPANNPGSFSVGATDATNTIAYFSSRGPSACDGTAFPHVVAPGANVKSAAPTGGGSIPDSYASLSGTSFSSPHVAAAAALLLGAFPTIGIPDLENILAGTTDSAVGNPLPNNSYGFGLIDVASAYESAFSSIKGNIAEIVSSPAFFHFGSVGVSTTVSKAFTVVNRGISDLSISHAEITGTNDGEFSIPVGDTCSGSVILPFSSCTVSVIFTPTSVGYKNADLSIESNDPVNPTFNVLLSGAAYGSIPALTASAPAVAWNGAADRFHIAFKSASGRIWLGTAEANGHFNDDWVRLSTGWTNDAPAIAWNSTSNKLVIAVASSHDTAVYIANIDADHTLGSFTGWTRIEAEARYSPAVTWNPTSGRLQIAVRATSTRILIGNADSDGTEFSGWTQLAKGSTRLYPSIAWNPVENKVQIAVKGRDNNSVYVTNFNADGSGLADWFRIVTGETLAAPGITWNSVASKVEIAVKASVGNGIQKASMNASGDGFSG
ncbi:MAG: choice-of-anchor D domain-containing protein, partial [Acidobacteria bacterium]